MDFGFCYYPLLFFLAFLGVLFATPILSKFAKHRNIVDKPGLHKTHSIAKPLLGGLAIFAAFSATLFLFLPMDDKLLSLILSTIVLVITGLLDDNYDLKPLYKLLGQTISAYIVVFWNAYLFRFMVDYFERFYMPGIVVLLLIIGWVVLMVNAFNLIDGLDGLAAGTAAIIFLAMAVLSFIEGGRPNILGVQLIGAGACCGFLIFNFNPAKIFMGDTGSMLLGFILATTHLFTIKYPFSTQLVLGSMFIFAYPALDVTYAFYRRICNKCPIFKADKGHIHHVLLSMGYSVKQTVIIIYMTNIVFSALGVLLLVLEVPSKLFLIIGVAVAIFAFLFFRKLYSISNHNGISA